MQCAPLVASDGLFSFDPPSETYRSGPLERIKIFLACDMDFRLCVRCGQIHVPVRRILKKKKNVPVRRMRTRDPNFRQTLAFNLSVDHD